MPRVLVLLVLPFQDQLCFYLFIYIYKYICYIYIRILGKMSFVWGKIESPLLKENDNLKAAVLDDFLLSVTVSLFPHSRDVLSLRPVSPFLSRGGHFSALSHPSGIRVAEPSAALRINSVSYSELHGSEG